MVSVLTAPSCDKAQKQGRMHSVILRILLVSFGYEWKAVKEKGDYTCLPTDSNKQTAGHVSSARQATEKSQKLLPWCRATED